MASAQVLPNTSASSRKQEHLEAGKRRLEEFRKKKAAERAKKVAPSGHVHDSNAGKNENQHLEVENVSVNEIDGVSTSDGNGGAVIDTGISNQNNVNSFNQSSTQGSLSGPSLVRNDLNTSSSNLTDKHLDIDEAKRYNASNFITSVDVSQNSETNKANDIYGIHTGGVGGLPYGTTKSQNNFLHSQESPDFNISAKHDSTGYEARNSSNHTPIQSVSTESSSRKSRPSFLDSLNVSRPSTGSPFHQPEQDTSKVNHLDSSRKDTSGSTYFHKAPEETKAVGLFSNLATAPDFNNSQDTLVTSAKENGMEKKQDYYPSSQNEDFSALEQHIEDLTQEKFSLQRALEGSRVLAESLATENSSLTENYNHQRSIVNQLQSEMENLQQEIKAQQVELEAMRSEYTNVQLECNAADERAKLLASEVIGLEEKALRLRSNELKLEKQLEIEQAEISSYRKKISSLEKDRHDLQSTIDALQEEKKMLLSKVRKASGYVKAESKTSKRDGSTSTDDLVSEDPASNSSNTELNDNHDAETSSLSIAPENTHAPFGVSPVNIPHDQMRVIENINALISELALEKEELMKSLAFESSESSRMKEINKELSRKLEVQTQRLELLTAQNMVNENIESISTKQTDSRTTYENIPYADEGDEVVERVLGWIMKLFPGGPSKRRTSKLL